MFVSVWVKHYFLSGLYISLTLLWSSDKTGGRTTQTTGDR